MHSSQKTPELEDLVTTLLNTFGSKETEHNWGPCDEILIQISKINAKTVKKEISHELFWKIHNVLGQCVLFYSLMFCHLDFIRSFQTVFFGHGSIENYSCSR
jgi:hypothetical protein